MKYSRFETLVLVVGVASIVGSLFFGIEAAPIAEEVVAQLLLLGVLVGAVHWGRNGGFVAATIASLIYIVMRIPLVIEYEGLNGDIASLILVRILTYGLVGIVGGELCGRIKYIFARLESSNSIDDWSQVYNQRYITHALEAACGQFQRYDTPFSVVTVSLAPALMADLRASKQRNMVRGVATHIRNDIRLVDELGRLQDGTFVAVLPHTPRDGAAVVSERLHGGICQTLGAKEESVICEILATPEDYETLSSLTNDLAEQVASQGSVEEVEV